MKCPKCGKEIADDSLFCEFCGTKLSVWKCGSGDNSLKTDDSKVVKSFFVVLLMFFIIIFSYMVRECFGRATIANLDFVLRCAYQPACRLICFMNLCMFVSGIVLVVKKKIRKSTAIALCVISACFFIGSFYEYLTSYIMDSELYYGITAPKNIIITSVWICPFYVGGIYAVYLIIAKWKNIKF